MTALPETLTQNRFADARHGAEGLAGRLPGLLVQAERIARTIEQGVHGRQRAGVGETFWQFRPYQSGEDAKRIDWRQSARSHELFVREQEWEAAQSVWIACDLSGSMGFSSDKRLPQKVERAVLSCLAIAYALIRGGERVALLGSGHRPTTGRFAIDRLIEGLLAQANATDADKDSMHAADIPGSASMVWISDFLEPVETITQRTLGWAGRGVRGVALHLIDPAEAAFPYSGRVLFEGMEGEGSVLVRHAGNIRDRYCALFNAHIEAVGTNFAQCGWTRHRHDTSSAPDKALLAAYQALAPKLVD